MTLTESCVVFTDRHSQNNIISYITNDLHSIINCLSNLNDNKTTAPRFDREVK